MEERWIKCIKCGKTTELWCRTNWVKMIIDLRRRSYFRAITRKIYWCEDCSEKHGIMPKIAEKEKGEQKEKIRNKILTSIMLIYMNILKRREYNV